jgi:hypothetical protein
MNVAVGAAVRLSSAPAHAAATVIGMTAVNAIGSGIVGAGRRPLSQSEVDVLLVESTIPPTLRPHRPQQT